MLNDAPLSNRKLRPSFDLPVAGHADADALPLSLLHSLAKMLAFLWASAGEHKIDVAEGLRCFLLPLRFLLAVLPKYRSWLDIFTRRRQQYSFSFVRRKFTLLVQLVRPLCCKMYFPGCSFLRFALHALLKVEEVGGSDSFGRSADSINRIILDGGSNEP